VLPKHIHGHHGLPDWPTAIAIEIAVRRGNGTARADVDDRGHQPVPAVGVAKSR